MKKKLDLLKLVPVVSGVLALAVEFIIQPKLDNATQEEMAAENKKLIEEEVARQLAASK